MDYTGCPCSNSHRCSLITLPRRIPVNVPADTMIMKPAYIESPE